MKKMVKPVESSTKVQGSETTEEFEVNVNFAGYMSADEIYNIIASDEDEAILEALEEASWDLSIEEIEDMGDGEYEVHVGFAGFVGVEEIYTVFADSEDEAEEEALKQAKDDLSAEIVEDEEE